MDADDSGFLPKSSTTPALHSGPSNWTGIYPAMNRLLERHRQRILFGAGDRVLSGLAAAIARWAGGDKVVNELEASGYRMPNRRCPGTTPPVGTAPCFGATPPTIRASPTHPSFATWRFPEEYHPRRLCRQPAPVVSQSERQLASGRGLGRLLRGVSRQFTLALYEEERRLKQSELPFGPARWVQPF